MATDYPRIAEVTATDRGPIVNVTAWILMVAAILFTIFRLVSNLVIRGKYGQHDWWIVVANAFAIGQTIATSLMVSHGLGQHQDKLDAGDLTSFQKALLASSILYITTLAANKYSLLVFVGEVLAPGQTIFRRVIVGASIVIGLYLIASIFTLGFGCDLPATYDIVSGKCIHWGAFWTVHTVADILACLTIFILPIVIVAPLQMYADLKAQIIFPFALEIPLCAFAIVRLMYLRDALAAEDLTWKSVQWQVWTQVSMHLGVVAANIPCLKMFMKGFESMLFRQDTTNIERVMRSHSAGGQGNGDLSPGWKGSGKRSDRSSRKNKSWKAGDGNELRTGDAETTAIVTSSQTMPSDGSPERIQESRQKDRIYKTTEWTVLGE